MSTMTGAFSTTLQGIAILLFTTAIWGSTFAVLKILSAELPPSVVVSGRFWVAAVAMLPILLLSRRRLDFMTFQKSTWLGLIKDGGIIAAWLALGYGTQTIAIQTTSANRAAFITALSVVLVPLWLQLFEKKPQSIWIWLALPLAVAGLLLLSWQGGPWVIGDAWAFACAITYVAFIISLEKIAMRYSILWLTFMQLVWVAIFATIWGLLAGGSDWQALNSLSEKGWQALMYLGLLATALTTGLQTLGQKLVSAAQASLVYSLEPVFAVLFSAVLIGEQLTRAGIWGALLMVAALMMSSASVPKQLDAVTIQ